MNNILSSVKATRTDTFLEYQTENIYHNLQHIIENATGLDPNLSYKILQIDWQPLLLGLQHHEKTKSWLWQDQASAIVKYALFLYLAQMYPHHQLVPTTEIDEVWHLHLLNTEKYLSDCEYLLGYYLHHKPFFGLYNNFEKRQLQIHRDATINLFITHFHLNPLLIKNINVLQGACVKP